MATTHSAEASLDQITESLRGFVDRRNERAAPINFAPGRAGSYFGKGLGSNQPNSDILLQQSIGVADMSTRAISNRIASLNPQVKKRTVVRGENVDEVLDAHPLKILLDNPHPNYTRRQLLRLTSQYILTIGEAYWLKIRNSLQRPVQLQPMPAQNVEPIIIRGNVDYYLVRQGDGTEIEVPATEIVRPWLPDPESIYTSEGVLGPNAINADAAQFAGRHLRSKFQNDAIPPVMLHATSDQAETPQGEEWERWKADWVRKYHNQTGSEKGTPAMLPPGWGAIQFAIESGADITPLLEYWQNNQLMNYGVPAAVLGRVVSGDRSSAEVTDWIFDKRTVLPVAELISDALTAQLAPDFDSGIVVEFEEFVAEDKDYNLAVEKQDLEKKVRTVQQIIADRGGDPTRAGWGELPIGTIADTPYTGDILDLAPMPDDDPDALGDDDDDQALDEVEPDNEPEERSGRGRHTRRPTTSQQARTSKARSEYFSPRNEWERVRRRERKYVPKLNSALRGIFEAQRRESMRLLSLADEPRSRAQIPPEAIFDPAAWDQVYQATVEPVRRAAYLEAAGAAYEGLGIGGAFAMTPTIVSNLEREGARMVTRVGATTQARLARTMALGAEGGESTQQIAARINSVFAGRRKNAVTIARTELVKATQSAQIDSFVQAEVVPWKRWNDNLDGDVRDSHYGSVIDPVRINDSFVLGSGATAAHPGDAGLPAGEVINCRCFVTPEFDDPTGIEKGDG